MLALLNLGNIVAFKSGAFDLSRCLDQCGHFFPRRTVRTDDRGPEGNGASGNIPKPRSYRPVLVMTYPDRKPNPSAYGVGCVTVLAANVTAVCDNSLPFTVAPVARVISV